MTTQEQTRPRHILYLHSSDDLYGADVILLQLVKGLDRRRYLPLVILPDDMKHVGLLSQELEASGIEHYHLPIAILRRRYFTPKGLWLLLMRLIAGTWAIRKLARRKDVAMVHGFTLAVAAAPAAAIVLRKPLLMHAHEILQQPRLQRRFLHGMAVRSADTVLCVSEAVRQNILEDEPWAEKKVIVIRNGIAAAPAISQSPEALRSELCVPARLPLIGMIGRVSAWKGQEVFARAASLLRTRGFVVHCVAIGGVFDGDTTHLDRLRELIAAEDIASAFTLVDFRKNARRYLPAFDIFVLPSAMPEPFGTVILEAMAAGVPVIGTSIGGTPEMIQHDETGLLVEPGNPEALADAIASLLAEPERARRMGASGQARFTEEFILRKYLAAMEGLYSTIGANPDSGVP